MHHIVEPSRVTGMCLLVFISCAGLGTAAFWATVHTYEPVTLREVRMVLRALFTSALATWALLFVTPRQLVWPVGIFFVVFMIAVVILLVITHLRVRKQHKEYADE